MSDMALLISSSLLLLVVNLLLLRANRDGGVMLLLQMGVSIYGYHGLYADSGEGKGLVWWFYMLVFNCGLSFLVGLFLGIRALRIRDKP